MILNKKQKQTIFIVATLLIALVLSFLVDDLILELAGGMQGPVLTYIFSWISYILSLLFVLLIMTTLFMWEEKKKDWIIPLWFSAACGFVISYILKFLVARERPLGTEMLLGFLDYSFPSTHAAITFAIVPILDEEFPMLKWFWILFAVFVAVSRIYLQKHYLSDVLAGILLGYVIGRTIIFLKRKHMVFD